MNGDPFPQARALGGACRIFSLTVAMLFKNWQEFSVILSTYNIFGDTKNLRSFFDTETSQYEA
jgi:hypothetical protein